MSKYALLVIFNMPFVLFGLLKAFTMYKSGILTRFSLLLRIVFWTIFGAGIIFAENIYDFLSRHDLSDTTPLSLAEVMLVTGVTFCLFLCLRLYSKLEITERRLTELHEALSIKLSSSRSKK